MNLRKLMVATVLLAMATIVTLWGAAAKAVRVGCPKFFHEAVLPADRLRMFKEACLQVEIATPRMPL